MQRWLVLGLVWALAGLGLAQPFSVMPKLGDCGDKINVELCVQPSLTFGLGVTLLEPFGDTNLGMRLALGAGLDAEGGISELNLSYKVNAGLWWDQGWTFSLLEAYAEFSQQYSELPLQFFRFSMGKRARYSGPLQDTFMGREGRWGLFIDATSVRPSRIGFSLTPQDPQPQNWYEPLASEIAYLAHPGFRGGELYVGLRFGPWGAGSFVETLEVAEVDGNRLDWRFSPRFSYQQKDFSLVYHHNQGLWLELTAPLSSSELTLDALAWWNPNWNYLFPSYGESNPQMWLLHPQKLFFALGLDWNQTARVGLDLSVAPVSAYRFNLQLWLR